MLLYDSFGIPKHLFSADHLFHLQTFGATAFFPNCGLEIALKKTFTVKLMSLPIVAKVIWAKHILLLFSKIKKT